MTNHNWAIKLFEEMKNRKAKTGFEVQWGATCRTNLIALDIKRAKRQGRPHLLELAYEVGMRQVGVGIETASPTILKNIDKSGQTQETIALAVKEVKRIFGYIDPSFIIGSPGETEETIKETVDFCLKHNIDVETIFYTIAIDKGLIGKAVTGKKCPADDDILEKYFMLLGENSEEVRTNFSDVLTDKRLIELGNWATDVLGSKNRRHPHTGDVMPAKPKAVGPAKADL